MNVDRTKDRATGARHPLLGPVSCCALVLTCCSHGFPTISGTVGGQSLHAADEIGQIWPSYALPDGGADPAGLRVGAIITSVGGACNATWEQGNPQNATTLAVSVPQPGGAVTLGTFPIMQGAEAHFDVPGTSSVEGAEEASDGTVTLTTSTADRIEGSFDLTFGDGHLTGSFSAPVCSVFVYDGTLANAW
jgi:hypothetical protein